MDGSLLVAKPSGWSTYDVIRKAKAVLRAEQEKLPKIGHTGTLDPLAEGLVVLLFGSATKRSAQLIKLDKSYAAEVVLGSETTTADAEGERTPVSDREPKLGEIKAVLKDFRGEITQTPPAYSAVKVGGKRAYQLARQGKQPALTPRTVRVYALKLERYAYPKLALNCRVSSGTYVRSLAEDIGRALGTGAYLGGLTRTAVGKFRLEDAVSAEELSIELIKAGLQPLPAE